MAPPWEISDRYRSTVCDLPPQKKKRFSTHYSTLWGVRPFDAAGAPVGVFAARGRSVVADVVGALGVTSGSYKWELPVVADVVGAVSV